jgi:AcrR family transcriptional regulator
MKATSDKPIKTQNRLPRSKHETPRPARALIQQRSRERLERILAVTTTLITDRGSDSLRMGEIAERSSISIGSLYQYFPDKSAIIRTLAERYNAQGRACVQAILDTITREDQLETALHRVVEDFYAMYLTQPAMREIWGATQADKSLQEIEASDTHAHAQMLCDALTRLRPKAAQAPLWTLAMLTMQLVATAVRLAISLERPQGDAVIAAFKRMLQNPLDSLDSQPRKKSLASTQASRKNRS